MTEDYVEEDNIRVLLTEYRNWLATTDIPTYFYKDLKSNITTFLNTSTLRNYLSKVIIMLKAKFPKHCDWEEPEWNTRMSGKDFEKKCNCDQCGGNVDVYEDTKRGLYNKASPWINEIYDNYMSKIALE